MKITILAFFLNILFFSCRKTNTSPIQTSTELFNQYTIKSGQNFGFCIGKCFKEATFTNDSTRLFVKENSRSQNPQTFSYATKSQKTKLDSIANEINIANFIKLNDVYGCPDCADGGSEWIEIQKNGETLKKVTFEYGKDYAEIGNIVPVLRDLRFKMIAKYAN